MKNITFKSPLRGLRASETIDAPDAQNVKRFDGDRQRVQEAQARRVSSLARVADPVAHGLNSPELIEDWRAKIDVLDRELLQLLNQRAQLAIKVGEIKRTTGLMVRDPAREHEVLEQVRRANAGPLDECAVTKLFRLIICESRRVESHHLKLTAAKDAAGDAV